jgi:hypothetical protein
VNGGSIIVQREEELKKKQSYKKTGVIKESKLAGVHS